MYNHIQRQRELDNRDLNLNQYVYCIQHQEIK